VQAQISSSSWLFLALHEVFTHSESAGLLATFSHWVCLTVWFPYHLVLFAAAAASPQCRG
jgi:hypothetical protein